MISNECKRANFTHGHTFCGQPTRNCEGRGHIYFTPVTLRKTHPTHNSQYFVLKSEVSVARFTHLVTQEFLRNGHEGRHRKQGLQGLKHRVPQTLKGRPRWPPFDGAATAAAAAARGDRAILARRERPKQQQKLLPMKNKPRRGRGSTFGPPTSHKKLVWVFRKKCDGKAQNNQKSRQVVSVCFKEVTQGTTIIIGTTKTVHGIFFTAVTNYGKRENPVVLSVAEGQSGSRHFRRVSGRTTVIFRACHGPTLVGRAGVRPGRPARPIKCLYDGPRPGPAHQFFRGWAAAWPSPSHCQKITARPGPSFFRILGPTITWAARGLDGPAHVLSRTKRCMCMH